ncbi:MAG: type II toxin-antitoxin system death-on-curing family toxin [Cyanobacteria bacterium J06581_3]
MTEPCWLEPHDVCAIYEEIIAESGGTAGLLSEGDLESTLYKPKNLYHYGRDSEEAVSLYELAAAYGYGLVKNHCFVDGNKRIALIAVYTFLAINGVELVASEVDAAALFLELAASEASQASCMEALALWLQENSETIANE